MERDYDESVGLQKAIERLTSQVKQTEAKLERLQTFESDIDQALQAVISSLFICTYGFCRRNSGLDAGKEHFASTKAIADEFRHRLAASSELDDITKLILRARGQHMLVHVITCGHYNTTLGLA